jgi:hypothetical protein
MVGDGADSVVHLNVAKGKKSIIIIIKIGTGDFIPVNREC